MYCKIPARLLAIIMVALSTSKASAQFESGNIYIGAHTGTIGVGAIGDQVSFGEAVPLGLDVEIRIGRVGLGGLVDYYSYHHYTRKYVDFLLPILYHIKLDNELWDPSLGFFLGYIAEDYYGKFGDLGESSPTLGLSGSIRYFFNDNWAVQARLGGGYGFYLLAIGVDYRF